MIVWLTGLLAFLAGTALGALLYRQFRSDAVKIRLLETKLETLQENHDDYKRNVSSHFESTARLMHKLTDSYREVYRQLASDAEQLCPEDISMQLPKLPAGQNLPEPQPDTQAETHHDSGAADMDSGYSQDDGFEDEIEDSLRDLEFGSRRQSP